MPKRYFNIRFFNFKDKCRFWIHLRPNPIYFEVHSPALTPSHIHVLVHVLGMSLPPWNCCQVPSVAALTFSCCVYIYAVYVSAGSIQLLWGCQLATGIQKLKTRNPQLATTNFEKRCIRNNICHIWHDGNYFRVFSTSHRTLSTCSSIRLSLSPVSSIGVSVCSLCLSLCRCLSVKLRVHFLRLRTSVQKCWFLATWKYNLQLWLPCSCLLCPSVVTKQPNTQQIKFKQLKRAKSLDCSICQLQLQLKLPGNLRS